MDPDKILQHIVGRTQISCAKILEPWAKGAQNGGEKSGSFFVTGTMNSHFFVTVQIGMKFGQKRQSLSRRPIEHNRKILEICL